MPLLAASHATKRNTARPRIMARSFGWPLACSRAGGRRHSGACVRTRNESRGCEPEHDVADARLQERHHLRRCPTRPTFCWCSRAPRQTRGSRVRHACALPRGRQARAQKQSYSAEGGSCVLGSAPCRTAAAPCSARQRCSKAAICVRVTSVKKADRTFATRTRRTFAPTLRALDTRVGQQSARLRIQHRPHAESNIEFH